MPGDSRRIVQAGRGSAGSITYGSSTVVLSLAHGKPTCVVDVEETDEPIPESPAQAGGRPRRGCARRRGGGAEPSSRSSFDLVRAFECAGASPRWCARGARGHGGPARAV